MNISVNHIDTDGTVHNRNIRMTRLAFAKHLAIAGQGYAPEPQKLLRTIGMFFHYSYYMRRRALDNNRFSEPPKELSDPTEKGQFSNLAGKAIADFLSKRIDNALYTVNYEAEMRRQKHKLKGPRPDLIAYSPNSIFAIEAKGRYKHNPGNMTAHKNQAQSGPIRVNFSIACVSFNLFNQINCNYHDPFSDNVPYDNVALAALTQKYYQGLSGFLNQKFFEYRETEIQGERFYEIELFGRYLQKIFFRDFPFLSFLHYEFFDFYRPRLILPYEIRGYAENGITNNATPFLFQNDEQQEYTYIDNDRVGLRIRG